MSITLANTAASLSGDTLVTAENAVTIPALHTFSRGASAPFAVASGAAVVTNLDADKLDGQEGAYYRDPTNLSAAVGIAKGGTALTAAGAADTVLTSDGAALSFAKLVNANIDAAAAIAFSKLNVTGISDMKVLRKSADQSYSSDATMNSDTHITFSIGASEVWAFFLVLRVTTGATEDFQLQWSLPASGTYFMEDLPGNTTFAVESTTTLSYDAANTTNRLVRVVGVLVNSTTAGTAVLQHCQAVSGGATTNVQANSFCLLIRIA